MKLRVALLLLTASPLLCLVAGSPHLEKPAALQSRHPHGIHYWDLLMNNPAGTRGPLPAPVKPPDDPAYMLDPNNSTNCIGVYETINFDGALYPKDTTIDGQAIDGFVWSGTGSGYVFVGITTTGNQFTSCDLGNSPATNGYTNAIVSTPAALIFFNRPGPSFAGYVCASDGGTGKAFIPQSVQATAAWRNNMTLTFTGYTANGAAVSQLNATINYGAPTKIDLTGLGQIYSMSFAPSGGQYACAITGGGDDGREFIIDDFVLRRGIGSEVPVTCPTPL